MTALTLTDAFATARFANCNPSWREYESGAPCDKRAIMARWLEIVKAGWQPDWGPAEMCAYHGTTEKYERAAFERAPKLYHFDDGKARYSDETFQEDMRKDAAEEHENQFLGGGLPV